MPICNIFGNIEIDYDQGTIYFHSSAIAQASGYAATPLRICGLGKIEFPIADRQIDVTLYESKDVPNILLVKVQK